VALKFEELRVLRVAEGVADGLWERVMQWDAFARDTVGKQMARAADSIGANIAEAYGRFHYGEKLQFLYYARSSLFETKYWLNRAKTRKLLQPADAAAYAEQLTDLARQLNSFASDLKSQRHGNKPQDKATRESTVDYTIEPSLPLFTQEDISSLAATPISNIQYQIPSKGERKWTDNNSSKP
jgi:four helix bundle protein